MPCYFGSPLPVAGKMLPALGKILPVAGKILPRAGKVTCYGYVPRPLGNHCSISKNGDRVFRNAAMRDVAPASRGNMGYFEREVGPQAASRRPKDDGSVIEICSRKGRSHERPAEDLPHLAYRSGYQARQRLFRPSSEIALAVR